MNIQQMQYIVELYREKSISKTAKKLFMTQPNLSNAIKSAEHELGFPIFTRNNKGIYPTEQGLIVIEQAGKICKDYEIMQHAMENVIPKIRICGFSYTPLCEAYNKLCIKYQDSKQIDFTFSLLSLEKAIERIYLSTADLAINAVAPEQLKILKQETAIKGLKISTIFTVPVVLRIGSHHPLYNVPKIRLNDFYNYTFIGYAERPLIWLHFLETFKNPNQQRIIKIPDRECKNALIKNSSTMYTIGLKYPQELDKRYNIRSIPLNKQKRCIVVIMRNQQKMSAEIKTFLELLKKELSYI